MRVIHTSDWHVTDGNRLADHEATLNAIIDDAIATSPDLWLVVGDLTGHEVPHRMTPREKLVLSAALVRMACVASVAIIPGNHDDPTDIAALEHLGGADDLGNASWPIRVLPAGHHEIATKAGTCHVYALPYPTAKHYLAAGERPAGGLAGIRTAIGERLDQLLATWDHAIRARRAVAPDEPHVLAYHGMAEGGRVSGRDSGEVLAGAEITLSRHRLDGCAFDFGALGHLHMLQEVAHRCFYPSSIFRNDFGEVDAKGWLSVTIGDQAWRAGSAGSIVGEYGEIPGERLACTVEHRLSPCRLFVTLDYRWAPAVCIDDPPRWLTRPTDALIAACACAEVRMRLDIPEQHLGSCPWSDEVARIALIAHRVKVEKRIDPAVRVRAPEIVSAIDPPAKMIAYFGTLADPIADADRQAAIDALDEIMHSADETIAILSAEIEGVA